ncbi:MAG: hypothetical protein KGY45_00925 [Hadesarchaea archaeon]|nr:hypothetical protein [Hadesarchaea archaeon]
MEALGRSYTAVLNPFSEEGKKIVQNAPSFDSLPEDIIDKAVGRVEKKSGPEVIVDFNEEEIRREVLSFYLMCQSVAAVSYPYSTETREVNRATRDTIRYRLYDLFKRDEDELALEAIQNTFRLKKLESGNGVEIDSTRIPREDMLKLRDLRLEEDEINIDKQVVDNQVLSKYMPQYAIRWTDLGSLMEHRKIKLTDQYIVNGWALLTPKELWNSYANLIATQAEEYISELYEQFSSSGTPDDILVEVGERISEVIPEETKRKEYAQAAGGELKPEHFPPCVKKTLSGVGSGNRNYAIVLLLTSFLSYARISPSGKRVNRIADFIEDMSVVENDIIPLIFEAAKKCNPPLFEDQPQDKPNVYYHLGFGMTENPRLKDSGKSKWYRPPNCQKIKTEAPPLCNPDDICSEIKNPLTYYYKSLSKGSQSKGD